jgi:predicted metal-dependent hydrolase
MAKALTINIDGVGAVLLERSKRSKYLNIFVIPFKGVRVAIPYGISFEEAEQIVHSKVDWIKKHIARIRRVEREYDLAAQSTADIDEPEARVKLTGKVNQLATEHGFTYRKLFIRNQKTRWGSCSHNNNISLNVKLMSLSEELADYVILHELMHTRIKNHRKEFWRELDGIFGNAKAIDARLRQYNLELL